MDTETNLGMKIGSFVKRDSFPGPKGKHALRVYSMTCQYIVNMIDFRVKRHPDLVTVLTASIFWIARSLVLVRA